MRNTTTIISPLSIVVAMLVCTFCMGDFIAAQDQATTTNTPSVAARGTGSNLRDLERAIVEGEQLIAKYPDSDFTPTVMFQLVELYVKRSADAYQQKMTQYEAELKRFDAGELKTEPVMPRVSYREAVEMGYKILEKYPTAPFNDKVVYRIALSHLEESNLERAYEFFRKLITEYPKSDYLLESHFRIGEYHFDQRRYAEAAASYAKLLNNWQNPFFDMALYKLAWSYYNLNDFAKAISTFIYLIDDVNMVNRAQHAVTLGKTKADLRKEAIEYVAQCFADYGGARKAETFLNKFGEKPYSINIFMKLAETYQARNFYDESTQTLEAILRLWPLHDQAPELQNQIVENYLRAGEAEKAEAAREALVKNYGPGSAWLNKYPEGSAREQALALTEQTLLTLATDAQSRAQKEDSERYYRLAIGRYSDFLAKFPKSANADKVQYYQAECYYEVKDFAGAADAYQKVVTNFPNSQFKGEAAYNRILSHYEELRSVTNTDSTTFYLADFLGTGETRPLRVPNPAYAKALSACNDFGKLLGTGEKLPEIFMKYGETLFGLAEYAMAQQVYTKLINDLPACRFVVQAHLLNAQCSIHTEKYLDAEKWARAVVETFPDSTRQVERARRIINSAKFKLAEGFKKRGEHNIAAQAFDNIAASSSDTVIAELALVEAALQYEQLDNKEKAIDAYEKLYYRFPNSPRVDETLFKAAVLCEELNNWTRAAQNYLTLAGVRANSPYASKAVFAAAQCYENAGLLENALKTYDRYIASYQNDPSQILEALCRAGEICYKRKEYSPATSYFQRTIESYRNYVRESQPVDVYLPAQAQFMLAEIRFETYRQVNLELPMERSLQRKQALFNEVLAAYKDAATYQVADWTTAASYRIGAVFEEFGRFFWESPRQQISEDLLARYEEQLLQKIRPFKVRAFETYQANVKQAEENGISNQWVEQSRQRIQALAVELGVEVPTNGIVPTNGTVPGTPMPGKDMGANNRTNHTNAANEE